MSRKAVSQPPINKTLLKDGENKSGASHSNSHELSDLAIDVKSDVERLHLHDQKERTPNSRGLKTLAKIFNTDRGSVSDTPTIFALLRASHIVSKYRTFRTNKFIVDFE